MTSPKMDDSLPPEVQKEIDEITARGIDSVVWTEDLIRIARVALRQDSSGGVVGSAQEEVRQLDAELNVRWSVPGTDCYEKMRTLARKLAERLDSAAPQESRSEVLDPNDTIQCPNCDEWFEVSSAAAAYWHRASRAEPGAPLKPSYRECEQCGNLVACWSDAMIEQVERDAAALHAKIKPRTDERKS